MTGPGDESNAAPARTRTVIGRVLFASAATMILVAALIAAGVIAVNPELRPTLVYVLGGVGVADALMGLYFILTDPS